MEYPQPATDQAAADTLDPEEGVMREEEAAALRAQILDALGMSLARTRTEAIKARRSSGIEDEWIEDEEYYEGIDDANRGEKGVRNMNWRTKPAGQASLPSANQTGSTVFVPLTRPYCDAAAARVADMLLPTDDRAWSIRPTPIPELAEIAKGEIPERIKKQIDQANPGETPEDRQAFADQTQGDIIADMQARMDEANERVARAEKRIEDWHVECQYHAEVRRVIEDAVRCGPGILKGPIPMRRKAIAFVDGKIQIQDSISPFSKRVDKWNFYPADDCGDDIHKGSCLWERDEISRKALEALKGGDYIDTQIDAVLLEGPMKAVETWDVEKDGRVSGLTQGESKNLFEIWYGYCRAEYEDCMAAGLECEEGKSYDVMVTMINNRVIKAALNHLDTGEFPYDVFVWQQREGSWAGVGVARQIRTPQRIVNAAARNLMDNAGLGGGPMWIFKSGIVTPINGIYELAPRKGWRVAEDADIDDVSKAFTFIQIPMVQEELNAIIQLGMKLAEDVTGLPMLMQGQQGSAPETVGGMQILNNNAGTVLRRVARLFDDRVTEPHVRRYYAYLLQYGEDSEKGDFLVDARGSSALVERDLQNQQIMQLGSMTSNPAFGIDPKKWMTEYLKSQKLDPKRFEFDDEKWQEIVANMSQPPPNPAVDVAKIRAESAAQIQQMKDQHDAEQRERDRELEIAFEGFSQELEKASLMNDREKAIDLIKSALTQTTLKISAQRELSAIKSPPGTKQVATPPTEPAGRAPDGNAYQR